jgi:hypothetical protein
MLTDKELLARARMEVAPLSPLAAELVRRFAADVAAADLEEAAWLERPQPVSLDTNPRTVA